MSEQQQLKEYTITNDMLATWRSGCIQWRNKNPDVQCYGCEYDNKERGGCDFDDDEMQKIFQSRPHPALAAEGDKPVWLSRIISVVSKEEEERIARKAREDVLDKIDDEMNVRVVKANAEQLKMAEYPGSSSGAQHDKLAYASVRDYIRSLRSEQEGYSR